MRRLIAAEFFGTALLLLAVAGSGVMGESLAGGNVAVALLANSVATAAALYVILSDGKTVDEGINALKAEIARIAAFLGIEVPEEKWPDILHQSSLDFMKQQAARMEHMDMVFQGGGNTFINKGTNGRWKDVLTADAVRKADEVAALNLTEDCARWLRG